ncbi:hypothetical protein AAG906_014694 [Vitis piasezkii]
MNCESLNIGSNYELAEQSSSNATRHIIVLREKKGGYILRKAGSMRWRTPDVEIFSQSSRGEDGKEALKWAALEKLPTCNRLRKGLLLGSEGEVSEVDIQNLGLQEKKSLVERLVKIPDEDNEKFLLKLKNRIDRCDFSSFLAVGIDLPEIEVRFEHLTIDAEAYVGSRALPSFINSAFNQIEDILNTLRILPSRKKFTILHDVSGIIKPEDPYSIFCAFFFFCRMTLLLGPPSSGNLLLALSGMLDSCLKVGGRVTYKGHGMNEFVPQRTAAYISQLDTHIGEMTVRETLAFSARCQGVGDRYDMLVELSRREKATNIKPDPDIDAFMKVRQKLLCEIFTSFAEFELFAFSGGQEIYVGPLGRHSSHLIKYFEGIGGVGKIKDVGSYHFCTRINLGVHHASLNLLLKPFLKRGICFRRNKDLIKELSQPTPGSKDLYFPTQYSQSFTQCMACLWKQRLSYWRNPPYTAVRFFFTTFIALMFGTMFWDLDLSNAMGSMYAAVIFLGFQNGQSVQPVVAVEMDSLLQRKSCRNVFIPAICLCTAAKFWYLFFTFFIQLYFTFFGMMAVAAAPNQHIAAIIAAAFYALWNLFSNVTVKQYLDDYFGFEHDFLGVVAAVIVGFTVLFLFIFTFSIKAFYYQRG